MIVSKESYFQQLKYTRNAALLLMACCFLSRECYTAEHEIVDSKQHRTTPKSLDEALRACTPLPEALTNLIACYIRLSKERIKQLHDMLSLGSRPKNNPYGEYYISIDHKELTALDPEDLILPCYDTTGLALLYERYYNRHACDTTEIRAAILQKIAEVVQKFPHAINELMGTGKTLCHVVTQQSVDQGLIQHDLFDIFKASARWDVYGDCLNEKFDCLSLLLSKPNLQLRNDKDRELLTSMIKQCDLNSPEPTPLYYALTHGVSDEIIKLLMEHKADPDQLLSDNTPVELARKYKRSEKLIELLSTHSKTTSRITIENALSQHTPLPLEHIKLIALYLPIKDTDSMRERLRAIMRSRPLNLDPSTYTYPVEKDGLTGLDMLWGSYLGCEGSQQIPTIIKILIRRYPELINKTDQKSLSLCHQAVHYAACWNGSTNKNTIRHDLLDVLRKNNSIDWSTRDMRGRTCLMSLMDQQNLVFNKDEKKDKSFITFLAQKCGINSKDYNGYTALALAILNNVGYDVTGLLIELQADPHLANGDRDPETALALARKLNRPPELIKLLEKNSPPSSTRS